MFSLAASCLAKACFLADVDFVCTTEEVTKVRVKSLMVLDCCHVAAETHLLCTLTHLSLQ